MIPTPYRAKGGAALLGACRPGEHGPFGLYDHQENALMQEARRSADPVVAATRARQLKTELAALADHAGAWLADFRSD
ncbi:hypothetical protein [Streptosporangium sp. NPDC051022]|uniref:hypothetical protein n=1 Tax=Streptosporangium sp. NPDC051022 TaxID=3155752 RepID=UPI003433A5C5